MKSSRTTIHTPSKKDLEEVAQNLRLDAYGKQRLAQFVQALAARIQQRAANELYDVVNLRSHKKRISKKLQRQLVDIACTLQDPRAHAFCALLATDLARLLSTAAFERAAGANIGDGISNRDHPDGHTRQVRNAAERSRAPYRVLEAEAELQRRAYAKIIGIKVLGATIGALARRIEQDSDEDRQRNIGGAEALPVRKEVLLGLIELHNEFHDRYGQQWSKKRYFELAEMVLAVLGQPTDGLEQATRRLLKTIGARWNDP